MCIIILGNPVDGFGCIGPFGDAIIATEYAECKIRNSEWWIVDLDEPC